MKKKIVITQKEWDKSIQNTGYEYPKKFFDTIEITKYEHDYEKREYIIEYKEK